MKMIYSKSDNIRGSRKNSYRVSNSQYCFGKGSTYDFFEVQTEDYATVYNDMLYGAVSPFLYKGGHRTQGNMVGVGNLVIIDIDSTHDILAELTVCVANMPFTYFTIPTQNHLMNGYKYRLIIPCEGIATQERYVAVLTYLVETYKIPSVDLTSKSHARFFAPTIPKVGQSFSYFEAPPVDKITEKQPYSVTQNDVDLALIRTGLLKDGVLTIDPIYYPYQFNEQILQFTEEMAIFAPSDDEVIALAIEGTTLTTIYPDSSNSISKGEFRRLSERGEVCVGDVVASLRPNQRVLCECPTSHLHTDQSDKRYAWLLKTGGNRTRLYCGSNNCTQQFGEYRDIVMPSWEYFLHKNNPDGTSHLLTSIVSSVTSSLVKLCAEAICLMESAVYDEWHEKEKFAREKLFTKLLDENTLHILILMINKVKGSGLLIHNITPAGSRESTVQLGKSSELLQATWFGYLFKPSYTDFYKVAGDSAFSKGAIIKKITDIVAGDVSFITTTHEDTTLKPSQKASSILQVDFTNNLRTEYIVNNSFDEPVFQARKRLIADGVLKDPQYEPITQAFVEHWQLPRGSVMLKGFEVGNLVDLLMLFSMLNLYSNGATNQRHTAFVINAPSGIGKTSLIANFTKVGLSNDDKHMADVFGFNGLYPFSVDDMKNKLWVTGDELNMATMKNINISALLGNLTRLEVTVNVKGLIDQSFSGYSKVLWGARAYEAISQGSQSYELRNRLFAINYPEMPNSEFLNMCSYDVGYLDSAVQLFICERYFQWKALLKGMSVAEVAKLLSMLKAELKVKYAGVIEEFEDEAGEAVYEVAQTDGQKAVDNVLEVLVDYRDKILNDVEFCTVYHPLKPNSSGGKDGTIGFIEESVTKLSHLDQDLLVIPNLRSRNKSLSFQDFYNYICDRLFKNEKNSYRHKIMLDVGAFHKHIKTLGIEVEVNDLGNRDMRKKMTSNFNTKNKTFTCIDLSKLGGYDA